jgi:hypothetical protein
MKTISIKQPTGYQTESNIYVPLYFGNVVQLPSDIADSLCSAGFAQLVAEPEVAVVAEPEVAVVAEPEQETELRLKNESKKGK